MPASLTLGLTSKTKKPFRKSKTEKKSSEQINSNKNTKKHAKVIIYYYSYFPKFAEFTKIREANT